MTRTKRHEDLRGLPEPIALTPDEIKQVAGETAGGCGCVVVVVVHAPIIAGGIRVKQ